MLPALSKRAVKPQEHALSTPSALPCPTPKPGNQTSCCSVEVAAALQEPSRSYRGSRVKAVVPGTRVWEPDNLLQVRRVLYTAKKQQGHYVP